MRLWQLPARALPVTLRPLGGETVISYTRRLSEANGLASTAIMRALGQVIPGSGSHLLDHDAWLNDQAIARLEALSALPRHRLATALPARRWGPPPLVPAAARRQPRPALLPPLAGRPAGLPVLRAARLWRHRRDGLVRPQASPLLCRRHLRWLGRAAETAQTDISAAPEILTAHRRCQQLLARSGDRDWAAASIGAAWGITTYWAQDPLRRPRLCSRWQDRASRLGLTGPPAQPAVTFPEVIALAQILTDLDWRRHVAMVREWQLDLFYQRIARRLGEPSRQAPSRSDPIVTWAAGHRRRFARIRSFWSRHERSRALSTPFPEKGQFR